MEFRVIRHRVRVIFTISANLSMIGKTLNHKNVATTAIYARLNIDPVRDSVEKATQAMLAAGGMLPEGDMVPGLVNRPQCPGLRGRPTIPLRNHFPLWGDVVAFLMLNRLLG